RDLLGPAGTVPARPRVPAGNAAAPPVAAGLDGVRLAGVLLARLPGADPQQPQGPLVAPGRLRGLARLLAQFAVLVAEWPAGSRARVYRAGDPLRAVERAAGQAG